MQVELGQASGECADEEGFFSLYDRGIGGSGPLRGQKANFGY
jgi:hypothetical protein